jgi:hypothetical protein
MDGFLADRSEVETHAVRQFLEISFASESEIFWRNKQETSAGWHVENAREVWVRRRGEDWGRNTNRAVEGRVCSIDGLMPGVDGNGLIGAGLGRGLSAGALKPFGRRGVASICLT